MVKIEKLTRYKEIATLFIKYGRADIVEATGLETAELVDDSASAPKGDPEELARDLESMGPTFVKIGQFLSSRSDLIAKPYLDALSRLQDDVEPFPFNEVEELIEAELNVRLSKAFEQFDPNPIASASLGQVHRATLRNGQEVIVKIQRPGVREQIMKDLDVLDEIVNLIDNHTVLGRHYPIAEMFQTFRRSLLRELNYLREANNLVRLGSDLSSYEHIVVPQPVNSYTTSTILTMDYIAGTKITSLSPLARLEIDSVILAEELAKAYLDQVLVHGFFHADPHPGNILVTRDNKLGLIDLGMVAYLTPGMQQNILRLLLALSGGDGEEVAKISVEMGEQLPDFDRSNFIREVSELILPNQNATIADIQLGRIVMEMSRISAENGMRPASELTMLGKTLLNLDEVTRTLEPDFNPNRVVKVHADNLIQSHMLESISPGNLFGTLLEVNDFIQHLPGRLNRLLDELVKHEFEVKVNAFDEKLLLNNMEKIANRITMGLVLAALIVGAALLMQYETTFTIIGYPGLAVILFLLAAAFGFALVITIFLNDVWRRKK
jgi:ubiquinone biosynthesis protein